ncbi:MAG: hypothetical protein GEU91_19370 [Rhizobiales bacterium]|nr:hypothetical protein [Hyphomicrobiales bacterium]
MHTTLFFVLALAGALVTVAAAPDKALGMALLSAVVDQNGNLDRGAGIVSSARVSIGQYEVIFNQDVRECTYVATVGGTTIDTYTNKMIASPARRDQQDNGVWVRVSAGSGHVDAPFHLTVVCGR